MDVQGKPVEMPKKKNWLKIFTGILLALIGFAFLASGSALIYLNQGTDGEGYILSNSYAVRTNSHAYWLRINALEFRSFYSQIGVQMFGVDQVAQTKWVIKATDPGKELFVGMASASVATDYLNVMETEGPYPYWEWFTGPYYAKLDITTTKTYEGISGPTRSPAEETIWISSAHFKDQGTIYWGPYWVGMANDKYLIIMNLDGTSGVQADLQFGLRTPLFSWLQYVLVLVGLLLCLVSLLVLRRK